MTKLYYGTVKVEYSLLVEVKAEDELQATSEAVFLFKQAEKLPINKIRKSKVSFEIKNINWGTD